MQTGYTVHIDTFDGPMDLLMHLIEKNKIDIYDIPIAMVTEQYLAYIAQMREFDIEVASEFLVMAATLLQIKSRMMLPKPPQEEEEDPRQALVERIIEYRRFLAVSDVLQEMADKQGKVVAREPLPLPIHHLPPENLSLDVLLHAFKMAMTVQEELPFPVAVVRQEEYSVQEKIADIMDILKAGGGRAVFQELFPSGSRGECIAAFLALLELIRLRSVKVVQQGVFARIDVISII